ncbi:aminoglycoside 2'-N-acetyltransferase I [Saccharothrix tamanrassetensis]|uniref:Aminoglycoside 2'-N-acetyltransferase I n=1 Tax=Saccharothrix tamanrassetensis TaxID=1051531 RepID=A0A841CAG0_9PSEU|nr:GNAT family N-acetyltransferase [Saccharothrix tamanrassetensis]MBB5955492.1 aminoglycoside 2'-N-acetyltransferase I [Saccharothrix tamanrassetensis]
MISTAHTSEVDSALLAAARKLCDDAFDGDFSDDDWEHALGGVHAFVWEGDELAGHGSVVQRRLLHGGRALRAGYVEAVAVRADRRKRGHGAAVMTALEGVVRGAYELGALASAEDALDFYGARGWQLWRGPTSVLGPEGPTRTEDDDGGIFVLPVTASLDLTGPLACDWRDGDVW